MPHSDIRGSKLVRSSPRLFAAYHVLHSLRVPRHPPNALKALDRSHHQCPLTSAVIRTNTLSFDGRPSSEGTPSCDGMSWRVKGSSFVSSTDRKTSLLRDRSARRAVKRAYRIWVSDAAHHCVQLRIDLLFTMSDNLHRVIEDRRDTNSSSWTSVWIFQARRSSVVINRCSTPNH